MERGKGKGNKREKKRRKKMRQIILSRKRACGSLMGKRQIFVSDYGIELKMDRTGDHERRRKLGAHPLRRA